MQDEIDDFCEDPAFAFLLLPEPGEFLVSEGDGIFLRILVIVLFHDDALFSMLCSQVPIALT